MQGMQGKMPAPVLATTWDKWRLMEQISTTSCSGFSFVFFKISGISSRGIDSQITSAAQALCQALGVEARSISMTGPSCF